jgi:two-component system cell cycle response regulator CpdR
MPGKVIVVEDDAAFRYALGKALEQAGYEVETYPGALEAWDAVAGTAHLSILVTDLLFAKGQPSGIALARSALYHHPNLPVIYMTAYPQAAEQALLEDGTLLVKPIDLDALINKIGTVLATTGS